MSTDEMAIRKLVTDWIEATSRGDLPKLLSLMSEDAVFLRAGQPPMQRDDFAAAFQAGIGQIKIEAKAEPQEIKVEGNLAYLWNQMTVKVHLPKGGEPVTRSGNILTILRKEPAGNWVLLRDANLLS